MDLADLFNHAIQGAANGVVIVAGVAYLIDRATQRARARRIERTLGVVANAHHPGEPRR